MQKQEDDDDGENRAFKNGFFHVFQRALDVVSSRIDHLYFDALGQALLQVFDRLADAVAGLYDISVLHLEYTDTDGAFAVDARNRRFFLLAVDDFRDLIQIHRRAALARHDDFLEAFRIFDLAFDPDQLFCPATSDAA